MKKASINYFTDKNHDVLTDFLKDYINNDVVIVCIGTDRCIGDCLGPLTGMMLKRQRFPLPVYGTVKHPIHALNLNSRLTKIKEVHPNSFIIAIDACLGNEENIGEIQIRDSPIHPGKGVGKSLPKVGDLSIIGIVDSYDNNELFTNRNIRLDLVMDMADAITSIIEASYFVH